MSALSGIRVLDFSQVMAGPFAAMLLADLGAEVIKIEPPQHGDHSRRMAPHVKDDVSGAYLAVNRNKRGIALDLKDERGRALAHRLAETADIVIENFRPGVAARLGIDHETLAEVNPRLIHCSISGFGQTGPYSSRGGFDLVAQGMTGLMSITGDPDGPPAKCGIPITDLSTGLFAIYGILGALNARHQTGRGQQVDASLFDTGVGLAVWEAVEYFHTGATPQRTGSAHRLGAPYQAFQASDGHFTVGADGDRHWPKFCDVIGRPELLDDPRFRTNDERLANRKALVELIEERTATRTRDEWLGLLEEVGVPAGPINTVPEALSDPHTQARNMVVDVEHESLGTLKSLGPVVKLSATPAEIHSAAPNLGEHSAEVLAQLGVEEDTIRDLKNEGVIA